jgi:hypothetical protein
MTKNSSALSRVVSARARNRTVGFRVDAFDFERDVHPVANATGSQRALFDLHVLSFALRLRAPVFARG